MRYRIVPALAGLVFALGATGAEAGTLADVQGKGFLQCGVNTGAPGFAYVDQSGAWTGFDPDYCRAVAAAVFGDASKVKFTPTTGKTRFTALRSGEVDVLARNTTWTYSRDADLQLSFVGVNYYDGQGFMVPKGLGVTSARDLDGASVCIGTGTTTELNLADYFRANGISYEPVPIENQDEARANYLARRCDVWTTDASGLAANRSVLDDPQAHVILPEIISKEPLGPLVREGDDNWADIARWTLNVMILAEEFGITSANVEEIRDTSDNPEVRRLLGVEGPYGEMLSLDNNWAFNVIQQVGNYSEVFDRHIGENTTIGLARGLNALYSRGGILYAPPMR